MLAQTALMKFEDRARLDHDLVEWHDNLPWILRSTEPCPESIYTARCVMKWRYQNLRIVLCRPVLLALANRGSDSASSASAEELEAVAKCRAIAKQAIEDIAHEWAPNQMLGWNGVWFLYQACMIPLVSIFWEQWNAERVKECQGQIEVVLEALEGLADWSLAARRSREVVLKMFEASKRPMTRQASPKLGPTGVGANLKDDVRFEALASPRGVNGVVNGVSNVSLLNGMPGTTAPVNSGAGNNMMDIEPEQQQVEMMGDDGMMLVDQGVWDLDGMLWGNLPDGLEMPYDGLPNMDCDDWGYEAGLDWGGDIMRQ